MSESITTGLASAATAMTAISTSVGTAKLFEQIVELIKDANPNAIDAATLAKINMYTGLVGTGLDALIARTADSSKIATVVDASAEIMRQVDRIWDSVA